MIMVGGYCSYDCFGNTIGYSLLEVKSTLVSYDCSVL
jgi:hypothetical protein